MNILVTGGAGFIASQVVHDLINQGHHVTCCVRNIGYAKTLFPTAKIIHCDFIKDKQPSDWVTRLKNIDVVINAVGILYHPQKKVIWAIHYETPRALFAACVLSGIKKIIQISALGAEQYQVDYAQSKKAADDFLLSLPLTAIILRPSLVYGHGSYGGSSLFRGLAALPFIIPLPGKGNQQFQPIHAEDLSKAITQLISPSIKKTMVLHAVGPTRVRLSHLLQLVRRWLGFSAGYILHLPIVSIQLLAWFGNFVPYSTMNTSAFKMLMQNNVSTTEKTNQFSRIIGFVPRDFKTGLFSEPSTVQDRWHARLYFLKPLLRISLAFMWIMSALCSAYLYPVSSSYTLLAQIGVSTTWQPWLLYGASMINGILGIALLFNIKVRWVALIQCLIIVAYTTIITITLPHLWLEPFGPVVKNIPVLVATFILLALESDR